jgi:hypothetical protein
VWQQKGGDKMKNLTLKRLSAGILTIAILTIFALPIVVSAVDFGLTDANPGLSESSLKDAITNVITILLSFLGIIAVIMILWGGFIYMTAAGEEAKTDKAKKIITSGIVGIIIIMAAWILANFVITTIGGTL